MVTMQLDHTFLDLLGDTLQCAASFWNNAPSRLKTLQAVAQSLEVAALKLGVLHTRRWSAFAGDALRRRRSGCTLKETMAPMNDAVACRGLNQGTKGSGGQKAKEGEELGGEGEEEGEHLFCLGQMYDTLQEREAAGSEWPPDFLAHTLSLTI